MSVTTPVSGTARIVSLVADLNASLPAKRIAARSELVKLGSRDVVLALIAELQSPRVHTRWEAAKALGEIGDPRSAAPLMELLGDDDADVRWTAAAGLAGLGRAGLEAVLHGLIQYSRSIHFCESAHHVLRHLSHQGFRETVTPVLAALEESEPAVSAPNAAYDLLVNLGCYR